MSDTIQISAFSRDSAAEQGSPAQGLSSSHGALYSPHVGPTLRRTVNADRLRKAKFFRRASKPQVFHAEVIQPLPVAAPPVVDMPVIAPESGPMLLGARIRFIQKTVAADFGITTAEMMSRSRKDYICSPRQIAMYLAWDTMGRSLTDTARRFGRDHTTLVHARRKIEKRMADPDYADRIERLRAQILEKIGAAQ